MSESLWLWWQSAGYSGETHSLDYRVQQWSFQPHGMHAAQQMVLAAVVHQAQELWPTSALAVTSSLWNCLSLHLPGLWCLVPAVSWPWTPKPLSPDCQARKQSRQLWSHPHWNPNCVISSDRKDTRQISKGLGTERQNCRSCVHFPSVCHCQLPKKTDLSSLEYWFDGWLLPTGHVGVPVTTASSWTMAAVSGLAACSFHVLSQFSLFL